MPCLYIGHARIEYKCAHLGDICASGHAQMSAHFSAQCMLLIHMSTARRWSLQPVLASQDQAPRAWTSHLFIISSTSLLEIKQSTYPCLASSRQHVWSTPTTSPLASGKLWVNQCSPASTASTQQRILFHRGQQTQSSQLA